MKNFLNIYKREFKSYFVSPIAYIVISIFLIITGWFFFSTFFLFGQAELRNFFSLLPITFSFIIPAITMRLFSEEIHTGSYELLYTMPVTGLDIILGKFFSALFFIIIMLLPTLSYGIFISFLGDLDWGPVLGGYIGAILMGAAYASVGLFASSCYLQQALLFRGRSNMKKSSLNNYSRFLLYIVIIVLLNIAGTVIFFRLDLTEGKAFSLSEESKKTVSALSEPLTIKVFFTNKLPAPYNNIERYLHDLLGEYAMSGNRYFNYEFYDVSTEGNERVKQNQELAQSYGIHPLQIQNIEQDEVKFQKAYMGMVLIHGDLIEALPPITTTDGLEFRITSTIGKMSSKTSALLNLKEKIAIKLFLSSSLQAVGPYMNLPGIMEAPKKIEEIVNKLNAKNYDRLNFTYIDPSQDQESTKEVERYNAMSLQWNEFIDRRGVKIPADKGFIELVVKYNERIEKVQILKVVRLPIFGTQYQMVDKLSGKGDKRDC